MKRLIVLLALLFSLNSRADIGKAAIGAVSTNPSNATVLATTGALIAGGPNAAGKYLVQVVASSNAAAVTTFDFQSIFGGAAVSHIYIVIPPGGGTFNFQTDISFNVPDNITLQVVNVGAVTGTVQANIFWALQSWN